MKTKHTSISSVAPILLFAFFAVLASTVLLTGAGIYRSRIESDRAAWEKRTASQYLSMRIRQSEEANTFFVGDFEERIPSESGNTFFSLEFYEGILYSTRIYVWNGNLCELFAPHEADFDKSSGRSLRPCRISALPSGKIVSG